MGQGPTSGNSAFDLVRQATAALPQEADMRCPLCDDVLMLAPMLVDYRGQKVKDVFLCQAGDPPCPSRDSEVSLFNILY
jgi:hypothetical protein